MEGAAYTGTPSAATNRLSSSSRTLCGSSVTMTSCRGTIDNSDAAAAATAGASSFVAE